MMELLAPAGNAEKLRYAYLYGADAAYIGLSGFSLRAQADNFSPDVADDLKRIKGDKRLYGAFNMYFHDDDIYRLEQTIDQIASFPFDALIISDIGILPLIQSRLPDMELHLSTQANCINSQAAALYRDLGFSRIIPGRELSLKEIESIKRKVPELAIEVFVHGAMCLAYSGRCFLSSWMTGRSANQGDCSHSCRWKYDVHSMTHSGGLALREEQRPDEYFPIYEGEGFTSILSSKDICMIEHLDRLRDAGVDSLKIEGRMKSIYYVSMVTRAYRRQLDYIEGKSDPDDPRAPWIEDLYKVSHREFSTGFFFGDKEIQEPTSRSYEASHLFIGTIEIERQIDRVLLESCSLLDENMLQSGKAWRRFVLDLKNPLRQGDVIEITGPKLLQLDLKEYILVNSCGTVINMAIAGRYQEIYSSQDLYSGYILRKSIPRAVSTS